MDNKNKDTEQISFRIDSNLKRAFDVKLAKDRDKKTATEVLREAIHMYTHGTPTPKPTAAEEDRALIEWFVTLDTYDSIAIALRTAMRELSTRHKKRR